jgi:hypothetical protein
MNDRIVLIVLFFRFDLRREEKPIYRAETLARRATLGIAG